MLCAGAALAMNCAFVGCLSKGAEWGRRVWIPALLVRCTVLCRLAFFQRVQLALQFTLDQGRVGAPAGSLHHYQFTLYALDLAPSLDPGLSASALQLAIHGHILAQSQWTGVFNH